MALGWDIGFTYKIAHICIFIGLQCTFLLNYFKIQTSKMCMLIIVDYDTVFEFCYNIPDTRTISQKQNYLF